MTKTKRNVFTRLAAYLRNAREEIRKITWPTRTESVRYSLVVIVITLLVAAFFGGLDWLFSSLLQLILL